jgi:hypothetical protein
MSIKFTKYALTKRVNESLESLLNQNLISMNNFDIIQGVFIGLELDDDTNLYLTLKSMSSLKYFIYEIKTNYYKNSIFLTIASQRRIDSLDKYRDITTCFTNEKLYINTNLIITNMSGNCVLTSEMKINSQLPDGTWIEISPVGMNSDKCNQEEKIIDQEDKVVKLWNLSCELYS